jgi:hypothetical protein
MVFESINRPREIMFRLDQRVQYTGLASCLGNMAWHKVRVDAAIVGTTAQWSGSFAICKLNKYLMSSIG